MNKFYWVRKKSNGIITIVEHDETLDEYYFPGYTFLFVFEAHYEIICEVATPEQIDKYKSLINQYKDVTEVMK